MRRGKRKRRGDICRERERERGEGEKEGGRIAHYGNRFFVAGQHPPLSRCLRHRTSSRQASLTARPQPSLYLRAHARLNFQNAVCPTTPPTLPTSQPNQNFALGASPCDPNLVTLRPGPDAERGALILPVIFSQAVLRADEGGVIEARGSDVNEGSTVRGPGVENLCVLREERHVRLCRGDSEERGEEGERVSFSALSGR